MNSKQGFLHSGIVRTGGETIIAKVGRTVPDIADIYTAQLRSEALSLLPNRKDENH